MAWISSRSAVRQTVGVSWVQPVPGEHVQSRAGLGAGALSTWGLLFCCAESGFFTAWKLLVWEFLLLFLSPGILTGARGYLQPALSTHMGQSGKRKAALGVLCRFLPPAPGVPAVLQPEMPRDVHPPSGIVPETPAQNEDPWGCGQSLGRSVRSRVPGGAWKEGLQGPRAVQAVVSAALQQGCVTVSQRAAVAQPRGWWGRALQEPLPIPTATHKGSGNPSLQQSRVSLTVCVRLLGWSPMRRVIPKLFLITFSIGGE